MKYLDGIVSVKFFSDNFIDFCFVYCNVKESEEI